MFFLSSDKIELDYYKSDVKKLLNIWNNRIPDVIKNILSFMEGFKSLQNVSGGNFIIALKILKSIKKYIAHTQHKILTSLFAKFWKTTFYPDNTKTTRRNQKFA